MTRRLLCEACGHRNDETAVVCSECGYDLSYAEAVFDGAESVVAPPPASASAPAEPPVAPMRPASAFCDCTPGTRVSGEALCWACGLPYRAFSDPASAPQPRVTGPTPRAVILLEFPSGMVVGLGQGLILGRDVGSPVPSVTAALSSMPGVSRTHAWLGLDSSCRLTVVDLGSRNGTWLGGVQLTPGIPQVIDDANLPAAIHLGGRCRLSVSAGESS